MGITDSAGEACGWTYLTNHGHVLACLASAPNPRIRDIAACVGVTERSVQLIIADLERAGVVRRRRVVRRNIYVIDREAPLHHRLFAGVTVGDLIDLPVPAMLDGPVHHPVDTPTAPSTEPRHRPANA